MAPMAGQSISPAANAAASDFVGRERERAALRRALADAEAGRGRLILIGGEPGIGKTRLADELAHEAAAGGALVAWGSCWEAGGAPAYWPWIQLLRTGTQHGPQAAAQALRGQRAPSIVRFAAQVLAGCDEQATAADSPPPDGAAPDDRFQLFDAVTRVLAVAARTRPLVLIIDDAHAADLSSLLLLRFAARELRQTRVLLLATYRDTEATRDPQRAGLFADLGRDGTTLSLRGLSSADIGTWLALGAAGAPPATMVRTLHGITEGNPFFLGEIVRLLDAGGGLHAPGGHEPALAGFAIPDGVRVAVRRRLALAADPTRTVLTVAAVAGRDFDAAVVRAALRIGPEAQAAALADAAACHIIAAGETPGAWRFRHVLFADTLVHDLPAARRHTLHLRVARAIEQVHRQHLEPHLAALAHHYAQALPRGPADKAIEFARRGAQHAHALLAYEEAVRLYETALAAHEAQPAPDPAQRWALLVALGEAAYAAGRFERTRLAYAAAADTARQLGCAERLARAALGYGLPPIAPHTVDATLVALLEEALARLGPADGTLRAAALARLASELYWSDGRARGAALSAEAVAMARRLGHAPTLIYTLYMRHLAGWSLDNLDERLAIATEIVQLAEADPAMRTWELRARYYRFVDLLERGDIAAADAEIGRYAALAGALRQHHGYEELARATRALMDGRLDDAEHFSTQALAVAQRLERRIKPFQQAVNSHRLMLRREQGRLDELLPLFRTPRAGPAGWLPRCSQTFCAVELGRHAEARAGWEQLAAGNFADVPRDAGWMAAMVLLTEICAALGDRRRATALYALLLPYADRTAALDIHVCYGAVATYLGMLAATLGDRARAEAHFAAGLQRNLAMGAALWAARTRYHHGALLLAAGTADDRARAAEQLALALASADALGLHALAARIRALENPRPAADATITIVFTDVQDSTGLHLRLGDQRAQELLRAHYAIVRRHLPQYGGREVKTLGDGVMLAFTSPRAAVRCAVALQRAFAADNASHPEHPLPVAMGIHTGTAIWEAGDFYGRAVIVAARLAAAARGGEVLTSAAVRDLAAGCDDLSFTAPRAIHLKGFDQPVAVCAVVTGDR